MEASQYKQQFLALLNTLYPSGLGDLSSGHSIDALDINVNNIKFIFHFDMDDFISYQQKLHKRHRIHKTLEESLNSWDHEFLKKIKISLDELPK